MRRCSRLLGMTPSCSRLLKYNTVTIQNFIKKFVIVFDMEWYEQAGVYAAVQIFEGKRLSFVKKDDSIYVMKGDFEPIHVRYSVTAIVHRPRKYASTPQLLVGVDWELDPVDAHVEETLRYRLRVWKDAEGKRIIRLMQ